LIDGRLIRFDFNFALHVFIPKGDRPEDYREVIRKSDAVPPIAFTKTRNTAVCGVVKHSLRPAVSEAAPPLQRRFIHGRNFLNNTVCRT